MLVSMTKLLEGKTVIVEIDTVFQFAAFLNDNEVELYFPFRRNSIRILLNSENNWRYNIGISGAELVVYLDTISDNKYLIVEECYDINEDDQLLSILKKYCTYEILNVVCIEGEGNVKFNILETSTDRIYSTTESKSRTNNIEHDNSVKCCLRKTKDANYLVAVKAA